MSDPPIRRHGLTLMQQVTRSPRTPFVQRELGAGGLTVLAVALAAFVIGLALATLPLAFLDGAAPYWQYPAADAAEHIIGGRYFIADAWRLPLLFVPQLGVPHGTNIGLTDSIPLAALIAKLLRGVVGFQRPYLPVWILACYALQPPAAATALYALGVRRGVLLALGSMILLCTPVLWFRFGHAALCAQYLILLALALHLHLARNGFRPAVQALYLPLLLLTLLVHIYLFAMVFAIMAASLLQGLWTEQLSIKGVLVKLAACGAAVVLIMGLCGYLGLGPIPMKPYGEFALDLAAPFSPGPSGVFGIANLPPGRDFEGFAWAGAGMALLCVVVVVAWRRRLPAILDAHFPLLAILAALIVLALSYAVRLGPTLVLGMAFDTVRRAALQSQHGGGMLRLVLTSLRPLDDLRLALYVLLVGGLFVAALIYAWRRRRLSCLYFVLGVTGCVLLLTVATPRTIALILSNFQASGRFVWVPLYLLALLAIAGACQAFQPGVATALLCVTLALQVVDIAPFWHALRQDAAAAPRPVPGEAVLAPAFAEAQRVTLVPTYLCAYAEQIDARQRDALTAQIVGVQVLSSRWAAPINSVRDSRMTATDTAALDANCAQARQAALRSAGDPGTVTLVFSSAPAEAGLRQALAAQPGCRSLPDALLCVAPAQPHG